MIVILAWSFVLWYWVCYIFNIRTYNCSVFHILWTFWLFAIVFLNYFWFKTFVAFFFSLKKAEAYSSCWAENLLHLIKIVVILRTTPFKAINFPSYENYNEYLLKLLGIEEVINLERFVHGASARNTALCMPMVNVSNILIFSIFLLLDFFLKV